jgi:hypothetical protein
MLLIIHYSSDISSANETVFKPFNDKTIEKRFPRSSTPGYGLSVKTEVPKSKGKNKLDLLPVNTKYKNTMLDYEDKIRSSMKKSIKSNKKNSLHC